MRDSVPWIGCLKDWKRRWRVWSKRQLQKRNLCQKQFGGFLFARCRTQKGSEIIGRMACASFTGRVLAIAVAKILKRHSSGNSSKRLGCSGRTANSTNLPNFFGAHLKTGN